jgi:hypothetical protein
MDLAIPGDKMRRHRTEIMAMKQYLTPGVALLVIIVLVSVVGCDEERKDDVIVIGGEQCPPPADLMPSPVEDDDTESKCDWEACEHSRLPECDPYPWPMCDHYVVIDGKMWTVCSTGYCMTYECSVCYAETSDFCGRSDWRLPTIEELRSLYDPANPTSLRWCVDAISSKVYIRDPFCLMESGVWSSSHGGYYEFNFWDGSVNKWGDHPPPDVALFVRP